MRRLPGGVCGSGLPDRPLTFDGDLPLAAPRLSVQLQLDRHLTDRLVHTRTWRRDTSATSGDTHTSTPYAGDSKPRPSLLAPPTKPVKGPLWEQSETYPGWALFSHWA